MVEPTNELLHCWGQAGKIISKLQMDNAGENKKLVMQLQSAPWKNPVAVEYTARDTPQQNSPVKVAFYTWQIKHLLPCITQTYLRKCGITYLGKYSLQ